MQLPPFKQVKLAHGSTVVVIAVDVDVLVDVVDVDVLVDVDVVTKTYQGIC